MTGACRCLESREDGLDVLLQALVIGLDVGLGSLADE